MGGKEFHFTWSKELGDLCDIYEEKQSGEDGNGLLVESGCSWRKLNVQRILDESATNHVKMLSKEAERKYKARKYVMPNTFIVIIHYICHYLIFHHHGKGKKVMSLACNMSFF